MGLYDRDYGRDSGNPTWVNPRGWSINMWIIAVNIAVFALNFVLVPTLVPVYQGTAAVKQAVTQPLVNVGPYFTDTGLSQPANPANMAVGNSVYQAVVIKDKNELAGFAKSTLMRPIEAYGHFSTFQGFQRLEVWRLVTFQFLHGGVMHIFFNMLGLWVFGPMVENRLGGKRYLAFYLTCGIFGGVSYMFLNLLGNIVPHSWVSFIPGLLIHDTTVPLVGASAGVFGVIMACAKIEPNTVVQLVFPPIPLKIRWLAYIYVAFAAANLIFGGANAGGDAAHVGGAIAGFFFIRNPHLLMDFFDVFGDSRAKANRAAKAGRAAAARQGSSASEAAEVDRILAKVATQGLHSLNNAEKATLARSTQRQRERDAG